MVCAYEEARSVQMDEEGKRQNGDVRAELTEEDHRIGHLGQTRTKLTQLHHTSHAH